MINNSEFLKRTVRIERLFDAPIELVWEAWTQPKHIIQWWNPRGSNTTIEAHNFEIGGLWKYKMIMPNGQPFIAEGEFIDIQPMRVIHSRASFKPMTEGVEIQSLFEPIGKKTAFTFNIIHPTESYKEQQERMGIQNGWGSVFERLEELLLTLKS